MTVAAPLSTLVVAGGQRLKSVLAQRDQVDDQVEAAEQAGGKGSVSHGESTVCGGTDRTHVLQPILHFVRDGGADWAKAANA
jgi:hypothetical protein